MSANISSCVLRLKLSYPADMPSIANKPNPAHVKEIGLVCIPSGNEVNL